MFCHAQPTQTPDHRRAPFAERAAPRLQAGGDEIQAGARWKRFLLRHASASGLEAARPGGTLARIWRGNHG